MTNYPGSYTCRFVPSDLEEVRKLPWIDHANVYHEDFKVHPALLQREAGKASTFGILKAAKHDPDEEPQMISILLHPRADHPTQHVVDQINMIPSATVESFSERLIYATAATKDLAIIGALDGIHSITPRQNSKPFTVVAREIMKYDAQLPPPYAPPLILGQRFRGANQIVGVADGGFDTGDLLNTHPAFNGRVDMITPVSGRPIGNDDVDSHGTHVAGCVLGFAGNNYLWRCYGTAPAARLRFQAINNPAGIVRDPPAPNLFGITLNIPPSAPGGLPAYIHNISYGVPPKLNVNPYYGPDAQAIDDWLYRHPEFTSVMAAGNSGDEEDEWKQKIAHANTAKSAITVGASTTTRPFNTKALKVKLGFATEEFDPRGGTAGPWNNVANWSSTGQPGTLRKPDIVAPGGR